MSLYKRKHIKLLLISILVVLLTLLSSCSKNNDNNNVTLQDQELEQVEDHNLQDNKNNEKQEESQEDETIEESDIEYNDDVGKEELKEIIDMNIGAEDILLDIKVEGRDILIKVKLGEAAPFDVKDLAISRYSSITDELLENSYWENVSVEFVDVGTITMNSSQAIEGEYGRYFESLDIEENFKE